MKFDRLLYKKIIQAEKFRTIKLLTKHKPYKYAHQKTGTILVILITYKIYEK